MINTKKKVVIKTIKGKRVEQDAKTIAYFTQAGTFDKDLSTYYNHKGLTYIINNPSDDTDDEEIHFDIELKYQDTPEQARLFASKSQAELDEIAEIKAEYGY